MNNINKIIELKWTDDNLENIRSIRIKTKKELLKNENETYNLSLYDSQYNNYNNNIQNINNIDNGNNNKREKMYNKMSERQILSSNATMNPFLIKPSYEENMWSQSNSSEYLRPQKSEYN
jgi:hypothetical protein